MSYKHILSLLPRLSVRLSLRMLLLWGVSLTLLASVSSQAKATLPTPIAQALIKAGLTQDEISLVIMPVTYHADNSNGTRINTDPSSSDKQGRIKETIKSHLPPAIAPKSKLDAKTYIDQHVITSWHINLLSQLDTALRHSERAVSYPSSTTSGLNLTTLKEMAHTTQKTYQNAHPLVQPIRHNAAVSRTPASTMKLIPTFIALDTLGKDFVWYTQVYHTGYVINKTLYGDLIIKGSGDPKLTYQRSSRLLSEVQRAGIHDIDGNIILDSSIFRHVGKDPALFDNDPLRPYNASPDGLLVNFNSMEINTTSLSSGKFALRYTPKLADYTFPSSIHRRAGRCRSISRSLAPVWTPDRLIFNQGLPRGCGNHTFYIAHPDPKEFAKRVIKQQWFDLDGNLTGDIINTETPNLTPYRSYSPLQDKFVAANNQPPLLSASPVPVVSFGSYSLANQIFDINHYSNNVMTEQVMLSLAAYAENNISDTTPPLTMHTRSVSYDHAIEQIQNWWRQHLTTPPPVMSNGSGLCRECTVRAENLAQLLNYAYQHPSFNTYISSLGVAGIDGTIATHKWRKPNSAAIGRAWIKTGTLDNVTAMAGYIKGRSQQDYIVVGIINTPYKLNSTKARRVLDSMLDWTARH